MIAVINGASGYIGFHLADALLKKGHKVYAVCRNGPGHLEALPQSDKLNIVISEQNEVPNKLCNVSPDVWYQLAWEGACGEMRSDLEVQLRNEILSVNAFKTAQKIGCKKIIYTGTVYENIADPILNNPTFDNNSFYIIAKKHAHEMTLQLSKLIGMEYVWCTFCHPVGKYMNKKQLIPYAVNCFMKNEPTAFGSCSQYFDVISVEYLAEAFTVIGENKCRKNFYYIGSGEPKILKDYLMEASDICGYSLDVGFGKRPDDGMIFKREWFDCSAFQMEFSIKNNTSFSNIINLIVCEQ